MNPMDLKRGVDIAVEAVVLSGSTLTVRRLLISTDTMWDRPRVIVCTIELRSVRGVGLSAIQFVATRRADA
jgi:hypothetical protein